MIIHSNIKDSIKNELIRANSVWIASAMISNKGWSFLQTNLSTQVVQHYLIGIDLATDPKVFESILEKTDINARVYESQYTFHPKVYLIQKKDNSYTAFIGSSNTTDWGLEKNIEMNYQINDQTECKKLLKWFNHLYVDGYLITQKFLDEYKTRYVPSITKVKEIEKEAQIIKASFTKNIGQFFSKNQHEIFNEKYHRINSQDLQEIRKEVRHKFLEIHKNIYQQFKAYGLTSLYCHHQSREIVSRHFFNQFSGNYVNAMWLHYGKSLPQLQAYSNDDKYPNKPDSFINNLRIQVIIHEDSIGIWLVLGRNNGSKIDRDYFRNEMMNEAFRIKFYSAFKELGNEYWITDNKDLANITTPDELWSETKKERLEEYFIIGCNIDWLDKRLSKENISDTILKEFQKLYPLYEMMRQK